MKNHENQAKTGVREEDLESLLHQVLREDGKVFPTTEQDIEHIEAEVDQDEVTPIDPARLLARVKGEKEQAGEKVVPLFGDVPKQIQDDMLAMAARNGGQISEDTRRQMDEDRENAEKRLDDQHDQGNQ
ncbi:MAG: hypothetical protein MUC65_05915 [Pontiellaceae bacterium]|jgi:hypothetical protein|nr:hypothetical protein [Pontiellaceae bacterium]